MYRNSVFFKYHFWTKEKVYDFSIYTIEVQRKRKRGRKDNTNLYFGNPFNSALIQFTFLVLCLPVYWNKESKSKN